MLRWLSFATSLVHLTDQTNCRFSETKFFLFGSKKTIIKVNNLNSSYLIDKNKYAFFLSLEKK